MARALPPLRSPVGELLSRADPLPTPYFPAQEGDTKTVAVCRNKQRFRQDNFWGSRVSALDPAVTKNTHLQNLPRTDLLGPQWTDMSSGEVREGGSRAPSTSTDN